MSGVRRAGCQNSFLASPDFLGQTLQDTDAFISREPSPCPTGGGLNSTVKPVLSKRPPKRGLFIARSLSYLCRRRSSPASRSRQGTPRRQPPERAHGHACKSLRGGHTDPARFTPAARAQDFGRRETPSVFFFFFFPARGDKTTSTDTSHGQYKQPLSQDNTYLHIDTWDNQT